MASEHLSAESEAPAAHQFKTCPSCSGDLQYQTVADVECLNCGEVFCHEIRYDRHLLWDYDDLGWMRGVVDRA